MNNQSQKTVRQQWEEALKYEGYEHSIHDKRDCTSIKRFSRTWRCILKHIPEEVQTTSNKKVFEFGCGGGKNLAQFLLNGWRVVGIDVSAEVLERTRQYLAEVQCICECLANVELVHGDFLGYTSEEQFDLVYHVGVVEHFLDDTEREAAIKNMFKITKKGGYVISIVPSGAHPLRQKVKTRKLGGYSIPEIDYTVALMEGELRKCGGKNIKVVPHNIMGYRLIDDKQGIARIADRLVYYMFQTIPLAILRKSFLCRHAMTLIGIAQK